MTNLSLLKRAFSKEIPNTVIQKNNPALTELVEGVAHELNNNVAIILGNVQLIKLKNREESVVEGLNRIEKASIKCSDLIKAIHHYAGRKENHRETIVNFADALCSALEDDETNWKEEAIAKNLTVVTEIENDNYPILADFQDLISALSHLIHNAVDASPVGGKIEISLAIVDELAVVSIADNGRGVAENIKLKIYEPFFSTKGTRGSGLGLTIVQSIVARHGGRIGFYQNKPAGTVFTIGLTLNGTVDPQNDSNALEEQKTVRRILIVDDDDDIRNVLTEMFLIEGYRPEHCPDAYCAMELLEKTAYDMVITDLGMPGMSGYDLAEYINDKFENIQIVLLSGWGSNIAREGRSLKGIKAVLSKPFRLSQILELVQN